jgi:hypothetical protein
MSEKLWEKALNVGLPHFEGKALVKGVAKQEAMDESGVYARHAYHTSAPYRRNTLSQCLTAAAFEFERGKHGFDGTALCFETNGIHNAVDTAHPFGLADDGDCRIVVFIEINRYYTIGFLSVSQAVGMVIDHENLICAEHPCAGRTQ